MPGPNDDNDDLNQSPAQRDAERLRARLRGEQADDDEPEIDDDDASEAAGGEGADEDEPQSRRDKKRNRYREAMERAERAEREAAELNGRFQQLSQLYEHARQPAQQQQGAEQRDELAERLDAIYRETDLLVREAQIKGTKLTPEEITRIEKRARELDEQKLEVIAERRQRAQQPQGGQQQAHPMAAMLQMEYPEVYGNQQAIQWASGRVQMLISEGNQPGLALGKRVLAEAREKFRLGGGSQQPAPRSSERSRFGGAPRGGSGGGGDEGGEAAIPRNEKNMRIARATYKHLQQSMKGKTQKQIEDAQWKAWSSTAGKRLAQKGREQRS